VALVYGWKGFYDPAIKKKVTVSKEIADSYIGTYDMGKSQQKVVWHNGQLALSVPRGLYYPLVFTSPSEFFLYEVNVSGKFEKDSDGTIELTMHTPGGDRKGKKSKP